MRRILAGASVLAAAAVMVVGCVETKQEFTLNPDGSGKVVFEITMGAMPIQFGQDAEKPDPELQSKQFVKQVMDNTEGIDAWSDVSYQRLEDGRTLIKGTAYFKDFSKVKFQAAQFQGIVFGKDDMGGMVLAMEEPGGEKAPASPAPPPGPPLSPDEIAAKIKAEREKMQQMRPMMEAAVARMKSDLSFRLPGTLTEVSVFQKEPSGAVRIVFDGAKMIQVMDLLMADDAYMKAQVMAGPTSPDKMRLDDTAKEKLFGGKGPIRARVTGPFRPAFTYDSEVAAAKANHQAMIQRLGLDKLPPPPPPMPPGFGLPPGMDGGGKGRGGPPTVRPAPKPPAPAPPGQAL
jgi:hypothetical protein